MSQEAYIEPTYDITSPQDNQILKQSAEKFGDALADTLVATVCVAGKVAVGGAKSLKSFLSGFFEAFKEEAKNMMEKKEGIEKKEEIKKTLQPKQDFYKQPVSQIKDKSYPPQKPGTFEEQIIEKEALDLQNALMRKFTEEKLNKTMKELEKKGYKMRMRQVNDENVILEYVRLT
ncbi:MAG TPA: hypothetical protein PLA51_13125 [Spirochaetota bacterium]|nr:hypothetical protein [Spirochaetota bacterium]